MEYQYSFEPNEKLKPCPFCGCGYILMRMINHPNPDWEWSTTVYCANCYAQVEDFAQTQPTSRARAIIKWERRV